MDELVGARKWLLSDLEQLGYLYELDCVGAGKWKLSDRYGQDHPFVVERDVPSVVPYLESVRRLLDEIHELRDVVCFVMEFVPTICFQINRIHPEDMHSIAMLRMQGETLEPWQILNRTEFMWLGEFTGGVFSQDDSDHCSLRLNSTELVLPRSRYNAWATVQEHDVFIYDIYHGDAAETTGRSIGHVNNREKELSINYLSAYFADRLQSAAARHEFSIVLQTLAANEFIQDNI
jgi:hypothetical protein